MTETAPPRRRWRLSLKKKLAFSLALGSGPPPWGRRPGSAAPGFSWSGSAARLDEALRSALGRPSSSSA